MFVSVHKHIGIWCSICRHLLSKVQLSYIPGCIKVLWLMKGTSLDIFAKQQVVKAIYSDNHVLCSKIHEFSAPALPLCCHKSFWLSLLFSKITRYVLQNKGRNFPSTIHLKWTLWLLHVQLMSPALKLWLWGLIHGSYLWWICLCLAPTGPLPKRTTKK